jgi:hypothetical protein
MQRSHVCVIPFVLLASVLACAPARPLLQPVLDSNSHLLAVGAEVAVEDIRRCRQEVYLAAPLSIQPLSLPPVGVVGPSTGGVVIGTVGPPHRVWESEAAYRHAIERCLAGRGYEIKGWQ